MQTAATEAQPSFARASVGFLASTTFLSIAMVLLGSF
jgi:hypothetical protein